MPKPFLLGTRHGFDCESPTLTTESQASEKIVIANIDGCTVLFVALRLPYASYTIEQCQNVAHGKFSTASVG